MLLKNYDELSLALSVKDISKVLGICERSAWNLIHSEGFPKIKVGRRIIIPKEAFINWINVQAEV